MNEELSRWLSRVRVVVLLLGLVVGSAVAEESEPWRFVSMPDFLKQFETSKEVGRPVFKGGAPLPRINLDGTVSQTDNQTQNQ